MNPTVGDLDGNADIVLALARRAAQAGAHLVAFPEMMLTGYPVEDLALRRSFVEASQRALENTARRLAHEGLGDLPVAVGYLDRCPDDEPAAGGETGPEAGLAPAGPPEVGRRPAGAPLNALAWLHAGRVAVRSAKHHLPNYGVFDEFRYFVRGDRLPVVRVQGVDIAAAICEDLWQNGGPVSVTRSADAGLLLVINGSPYERCKDDVRLDLCARRAREAGCALAYVNMVGGQDELVFDGDSLIVGAEGELLARAPQFEEHLLVADLTVRPADPALPLGEQEVDADDGTTITVDRRILSAEPAAAYEPVPAERAAQPDDHAEVYGALVLGLRDYVRKNGFRSVILGLSGGIDSALVATIAADAIGPENVHVVLMPSRWSSDHSVTDAEDLVKRQELTARTVAIRDIVDSYEADLELTGLAAENLQARVRGNILMALSNEHGHLVLTTGNKSELATGYSTLYGDSAGGFAPIKDLTKMMVWALSRWRNAQAETGTSTGTGTGTGKKAPRDAATGTAADAGNPFLHPFQVAPIPVAIIEKEPSAELRPGQLDTDSLPDYAVLDALLTDYVEQDLGRDALIEAGHDPELVERVIRLVDRAEYKRRQYPPGPKISPKNFGRDRRLPITSRWREPAAEA